MSEEFQPQVNASNEFLQIANDFGEPLEIVREALSNAYDSGATEFSFNVSLDSGSNVVIEMRDNGLGMSYTTLKENFWDLGNSSSAKDASKIGEKGHGTKIYLLSKRVFVMTSDGAETSQAECLYPQDSLNRGELHKVTIQRTDRDNQLLPTANGTYIRVEGYNNNDQKTFRQEAVEDYSYWFTKLGSFENQLESYGPIDLTMNLSALGAGEPKPLPFGHPFPQENYNINELSEQYGAEAADHFAKKYVYESQRLEDFPGVSFDMVVFVEGDAAKRTYNNMLRSRKSKSGYKVSDRYGLWLSKDFIPVERKNEWITSFGTGSNSVTMLHGFVNCQQLRLTANRGNVSNTNPDLINALRERVHELLGQINEDAYRKNGLKALAEKNEAEKINEREHAGYKDRIEKVRQRQYFDCGDSVKYYQPSNESELFGMFISYYALHQEDFAFEPVDYVTSVGVDVLAKDKNGANPADTEYWYVELKNTFGKVQFNHSFSNIRYILCWEIDEKVDEGTAFRSVLNEERVLKTYDHGNGEVIYRLIDPSGVSSTSIQVIQLKDLIEARAASAGKAGLA